MIKVIWDKKFSVGHERIDHEHQVFLDLIKNVSSADEEHFTKERITRLLLEIKKYAEFHFVSEENIMMDCDYPELEQHMEEHKRLLVTLEDKLFNYRSGTLKLDQIVDFLFEWFALHTTSSDKKLAKYVNNI